MYEYTTKQSQRAEEKHNTESRTSDFKIVAKFMVRVASLFAVYFLLDNNFTIINCIVSLFLITSLLMEIMQER